VETASEATIHERPGTGLRKLVPEKKSGPVFELSVGGRGGIELFRGGGKEGEKRQEC